jgi:hypothetical protein
LTATTASAEVIHLKPADGRSSNRQRLRLDKRTVENRQETGWVRWKVSAETAGEYRLVFEHRVPEDARATIEILLDGRRVDRLDLHGSPQANFRHHVLDAVIELAAGEARQLTLRFQEVTGESRIILRNPRLTDGYRGDYGFIKPGQSVDGPETRQGWARAMAEARRRGVDDPKLLAKKMWNAFPAMCDWFLQDNPHHGQWGQSVGHDARGDFKRFLGQAEGDNAIEIALVRSVARELGVDARLLGTSEQLLQHYVELCMRRRRRRLARLTRRTDAVVYATHQNMGGIYLETENQRCPDGSQLRILRLPLRRTSTRDELLLDSGNGIVRDPELSFDARKLLFAWNKSNRGYGGRAQSVPASRTYKIYQMDLATREVRALTDETTYGSDIDPMYLPSGDILFNSQRCVQRVTCGWAEATNLYVMDADGRYARRIGFDQTQTAFPALLEDGRVLYTRRDYNDRGQTYAHALFVMNPDGTMQTEYYGNQTFEPTSFQHARGIPGTSKVMAIAGGYHTPQGGKLVIIDRRKGLQDYQGLMFVDWDPDRKRTRGDGYGREGPQYSYPYPLDDHGLLVSYAPIGGYLMSASGRVDRRAEQGLMRYKLYFMTLDGKRELLAAHRTLSCASPVPLMARRKPTVRPNLTDYSQDTAVMYVQNVYHGPGMEGVEPPAAKQIRVIRLHYKPALIGAAVWSPPRDQIGPGRKYASVGKHSVTPVGVGTASFDAKEILGQVPIRADGSAMFEVPARTPLYLQLIDADGRAIQTMRSWATLMPGENFSCVGCHEDKASAPLSAQGRTQAMRDGPRKLRPLHDISGRPFSYARMIQPIWNRRCVSCHRKGGKAEAVDLTATIVPDNTSGRATNTTLRRYYRSYLTLLKAAQEREIQGQTYLGPGKPNKWVDYYTRLLTVEQVAPYYAGSARSGLLKMLRDGHKKVKLTPAELETIAAWIDLNVPFIGEYDEMNSWSRPQREAYEQKMLQRRTQRKIEDGNIRRFLQAGQP